MRNLAPGIYRQHALIEGTCARTLSAEQIVEYLRQLADAIDMEALNEPITHRLDGVGEAAWMHWKTSGVHGYTWERPDEGSTFFSFALYSCKQFSPGDAAAFTAKFFGSDDIQYAPLVPRETMLAARRERRHHSSPGRLTLVAIAPTHSCHPVGHRRAVSEVTPAMAAPRKAAANNRRSLNSVL